ncbi:MAG: CotH kinase family protein [Bacteroidaceae bacterium]|nr:CotH kinase family protein [Bacteroidaceae bacterium]
MKRKHIKQAALLLTMATCLMPTTQINAQFGGFNMGGFNMGDFKMEDMLPKVKHTKMEQLESNLPVITITTDKPLTSEKKVMAKMKMEGYDGYIGIKLRGNSSLAFNQKKYTVETRDEDGNELKASLLGMPAGSHWVLLSPYNDVSMIRDPFAFHLWREMGHWGPRTRMVEVLMDGEYLGIYILSEAIKRGTDRVNIDKMQKTDTEGTALTGGYILRIDTYNEEDATFPSKVPGIGEGIMTSQITWSCIYPKKKNMQPEQQQYIQNYVDEMEQVIQSPDFADPKSGYAKYIDVPSFVDYFIHTELSLNADGYKRSAYFYKERQHADGTGGKMFAGPVWDYNLAYGNCNFCNANKIDAWCFEGGNTQPTPALWQRLLQDPAFRKMVKTRYFELRKGVMSDKAINAYIDNHVKLVEQAKDRHFKEYPELLVDEKQKKQQQQSSQQGGFGSMFGGFQMPEGFGGMQGFGGFGGMQGMGNGGTNVIAWYAAYQVSSYEEEIKVLKKWLADRLAFLDKNIARFDKDFEPHIQPPTEIKPQFNGGFPFMGF